MTTLYTIIEPPDAKDLLSDAFTDFQRGYQYEGSAPDPGFLHTYLLKGEMCC